MRVTTHYHYKNYPLSKELSKRSKNIGYYTSPSLGLCYSFLIALLAWKLGGTVAALIAGLVSALILLPVLPCIREDAYKKLDAEYAELVKQHSAGSSRTSARTSASGAGATPGHQQASAANASRIADLNALLAERKKETPRGTPLKKENIQLGPMLDQFYHGCDYYDAAGHRVMKYICIPDGPQGFGPIKVPEEIETLEQLMPWLVENHDFHLKK